MSRVILLVDNEFLGGMVSMGLSVKTSLSVMV
jgi:hypothetical protein